MLEKQTKRGMERKSSKFEGAPLIEGRFDEVGEKLKDGDKLGSALGFIDGTIEDVGVLVTVGNKEGEILNEGIKLG